MCDIDNDEPISEIWNQWKQKYPESPLPKWDDEEILLAAWQRGELNDMSFLGQMFDWYFKKLTNKAKYYGCNDDDANDVAMECLYSFVEKCKDPKNPFTHQPGITIYNYLIRQRGGTLRNAIRDIYQKRTIPAEHVDAIKEINQPKQSKSCFERIVMEDCLNCIKSENTKQLNLFRQSKYYAKLIARHERTMRVLGDYLSGDCTYDSLAIDYGVVKGTIFTLIKNGTDKLLLYVNNCHEACRTNLNHKQLCESLRDFLTMSA